jgi:hypothetical protein
MAAGVPIVAENKWGWTEMLEHEKSGLLCDTDAELSYWPAHLAENERRRIELAVEARAHVERLSEPGPILAGWERLFRFVGTDTKTTPNRHESDTKTTQETPEVAMP